LTTYETSLAVSRVSLDVNPSGLVARGCAVGRRLVIRPESDADFVSHVCGLADRNETVEALESALRPKYPTVVVHNGIDHPDGTVRWYVYRDGRWHA
jgi:hypothetical protein